MLPKHTFNEHSKDWNRCMVLSKHLAFQTTHALMDPNCSKKKYWRALFTFQDDFCLSKTQSQIQIPRIPKVLVIIEQEVIKKKKRDLDGDGYSLADKTWIWLPRTQPYRRHLSSSVELKEPDVVWHFQMIWRKTLKMDYATDSKDVKKEGKSVRSSSPVASCSCCLHVTFCGHKNRTKIFLF